MSLPVFTLFEVVRYERLWSALRAAGPAAAWRLMNDIARFDLPAYDSIADPSDTSAAMAAKARDAMAGLPGLTSVDIEAAAKRYGDYGPRMQLEATFVTLWLDDRSRLDEVVEVRGGEHLDEALELGRGALALPLHLGASYVIPPIVAHRHPTRFVFNRMNFEELRDRAFPSLDVDAFAIDDDATFRKGLRALKDGLVFAMFPEFDPRGRGRHHTVVPFLGSSVIAPQGPAIMSRAAGAPMLPMHLDRTGEARFVLTIHPAMPAPTGDVDVEAATLALWRLVEGLILDGRVGDWEMWTDFDLMRTDAAA
jgi:lauroyl/myristoyl acyltransferase